MARDLDTERRRGRLAAFALSSILLAVVATLPSHASPSPSEAAARGLEGLWLGTAGTELERVAVGLELRRDAAGALHLRLTQPVSNYYGVEFPGEVRVEGNRIVVEALHLDLELVDGRLVGHYPGPKSPASFERAPILPGAPAVPELPSGPEPLWNTVLGGQVFASPTVADGVAYVGTTGGVMNAVRVEDGRFVWAFRAGRPIFGAALAAGDALYFVCDSGHLFALDRATGEERWRYDLGDGRVARVLPHPAVFDWDWQAPTPVVVDGTIYVGAGDGSFHAVDAATGARRWRVDGAGKVRTGAVVDGARVIFGGADHFVRAHDRSTGRELWRHDTGAEVDTTPVVFGGRVLVGNRGHGLRALDAATGELIWKSFFWGSWVESTPVVVDGTIYVGSSDLRRVSALDPANGRVLWRTDVFGWSWGTPLVTDSRIYAGAAGGAPYFLRHVASLTALDRATGRPLWRRPLPRVEGAHQWGIAGSPALAGGRLLVATIEGALSAYPVE